MTIYLLRHAKAGSRSDFFGADWLRPLTSSGQAQARELIGVYQSATFSRVLASPYVRCMETVVPLAAAHRVPIEPNDGLEEGAALDAALELMQEHATEGAVLCSHGDVIPLVLEHLLHQGVDLGPAPRCEKGSTWEISGDIGPAATATYWSPPPGR